MAFIAAVAIGTALAGAAYWSWEIVVIVNHLRSDVCELDDQIRANTAVTNHMPVLPPRDVADCRAP